MQGLKLNRSQQYAASFYKGAMLVLAGPGSGKTAVITSRVLTLIEEWGVPPENILVITFSKAAAEEMKNRFQNTGRSRYESVTFGTFHAIFFRIIREAYDYDTSNIISDREKNIYLDDAMKQAGVTVQNEREFREKLSACVSAIKGAESLIEKAARNLAIEPQKMAQIYDEYVKNMKNAGKIDFDDMMLLCLEIFTNRPDILKIWQEKFRFILIDEFQDINPLQYRLVKMLALPENNLFAVGDDDQSIYGFRGASPRLMFEFEKDYKGCRRALLDTNYRSGEEIIAGAARLIANNRERFRKRTNSHKGPGARLSRLHFANFEEEMEHICTEISKKMEEGEKLAETAVLYRMNNEIRPLYNRMLRMNIPCRLREKTADIFDHWIAQDIEAYLRIIDGSTDRSDFVRIANKPVRYIGRDSFRTDTVCFQDLFAANRDRSYVTEKLEKFRHDIDFMRMLDVSAMLKYLYYGASYGRYLKEYAASKNLDEEELTEIYREISDSAKGMDRPKQWMEYVSDHKEKVRKKAEEERNKKNENEPDGVELMTFHRSKGLEFDTVFIIDASEGFVPQSRAETAEEIEEERRAFYVAVTRARNELFICDCDDRLGRSAKPSRFISEMGLI
ncbi:MAG: ATP-dependent helicase [Lachnospiraceae bacterium]|nr:ATP-dependent helicase [Lachnospiraceae bacterium]